MIFNFAPGSLQSAERTAKPSIAELSQNGMFHPATISSASTRPAASSSATRSTRTGATLARMIRRASSKEGIST